MLDKIRDEFSLVITYRYDNFIIGNDAYWHGDKGNAMLTALHRDTQDGEQPVAFRFRTWAFIRIGDIFQKRFRNFQLLGEEIKIIVIGAFNVYPAIGHPLRLFYKAGFRIKVRSHRNGLLSLGTN